VQEPGECYLFQVRLSYPGQFRELFLIRTISVIAISKIVQLVRQPISRGSRC